MEETSIAPCGMNCSLCVAYQFKELDFNKNGFHRRYCPGCIKRGEHCLHMGDRCELLKKGEVRFCFECAVFPCPRLKSLDKRYRSKYHMSMIGNLECIKSRGMNAFLEQEREKWCCPGCGGVICCHNGLCLKCNSESLVKNKAYRWNDAEHAGPADSTKS